MCTNVFCIILGTRARMETLGNHASLCAVHLQNLSVSTARVCYRTIVMDFHTVNARTFAFESIAVCILNFQLFNFSSQINSNQIFTN